MSNQTVILNLPKDLGDCALSIPAIKSVKAYCEANNLTLIAAGNARSTDWVQTLGDLTLDVRTVDALPQDASLLINLNFYDDSIQAALPAVPFYQPEKMEVIPADTEKFGEGAVVGKKHISELMQDCLRDAGILKADETLPLPSLPTAFTDEAFVAATKERFGVSKSYVVLIPVCAANRPLKRWQTEKFVEVAQYLKARGWDSLLIGGPSDDEKKLCTEIAERAGKGVKSICGETSLAEIAALAKGAQMTVGCDTGPSHIAALSGSETFILFGYYNDPATWAPRTAGNTAHVISADRIPNITVHHVLYNVLGGFARNAAARHQPPRA